MGRNNKKNKRAPKRKLVINFDKDARKEYLLGFSKRKQQRREKALEQLKEQAKAERKKALQEQREAFHASRVSKGNQEQEDDQNSTSEETKQAENVLSELWKATTKTEEITDEFSRKAFGNSTVKITTTTLGSDSEDSDADVSKNMGWGNFSGKKNVKTPLGKAGKTLQKLQAVKDKKAGRSKKRKGKGNAEQGSRKRKKAGAKERRRRK